MIPSTSAIPDKHDASRTPDAINYLLDETDKLAVIFATPAAANVGKPASAKAPPLRTESGSKELRDWIRNCNTRITTLRPQSSGRDEAAEYRSQIVEQFPKHLQFAISALFDFSYRVGKFENSALADRINPETRTLVSGLMYHQQHLQQSPAVASASNHQLAYSRNESEATWTCYQDIINHGSERHGNGNQRFNVTLESAEHTYLPIPTLCIRLIIQNVLFAVHSGSGGVRPIDVRLSNERARTADKDYFCLSIRSQARPLQELLATACRTENRNTKTFVFEGSGIGHVIAAKLVELLAGEIVITSHADGTTTAKIMIPLRQQKASASEATLFENPGSPKTRGRDAFSVLYIEDMKSHALLVKQIFQRMGNIELLLAATADAGLELARTCKPDLILLDMELPDMKGLEVYRQLQAAPQTAGITVFAISASAMPDQVNQALDAGIKHYLTKPFSYKELIQMLQDERNSRHPQLPGQ